MEELGNSIRPGVLFERTNLVMRLSLKKLSEAVTQDPTGFETITSRRRFIALMSCLLLGTSGCDDELDPPDPKEPEDRAAVILGAETVDILRGATKVRTYALDPNRPMSKKPKRPNEMRIGGYYVKAMGKDVGGAKLDSLRYDILFKNACYGEVEKSYCFIPYHAIRIEQGTKRAVEILLSMKCQKLRIFTKNNEKVIHVAQCSSAKPDYTGNFDDATYTKLVKLLKDSVGAADPAFKSLLEKAPIPRVQRPAKK